MLASTCSVLYMIGHEVQYHVCGNGLRSCWSFRTVSAGGQQETAGGAADFNLPAIYGCEKRILTCKKSGWPQWE